MSWAVISMRSASSESSIPSGILTPWAAWVDRRQVSIASDEEGIEESTRRGSDFGCPQPGQDTEKQGSQSDKDVRKLGVSNRALTHLEAPSFVLLLHRPLGERTSKRKESQPQYREPGA
jgi:hypothetical protein